MYCIWNFMSNIQFTATVTLRLAPQSGCQCCQTQQARRQRGPTLAEQPGGTRVMASTAREKPVRRNRAECVSAAYQHLPCFDSASDRRCVPEERESCKIGRLCIHRDPIHGGRRRAFRVIEDDVEAADGSDCVW